METINIVHLYYDLSNLYGEHGNILCLKKYLENYSNVNIDYLSINDDIDFNKYDIFYLGCGNNDAYLKSLNHLLNYKNNIVDSINNNKFFIVTGKSLDLFGTSYNTLDNKKIDTLNIFPYESWESSKRLVGEQIYKFNDLTIIGFENRDSILKYVKTKHLFEVKKGFGYNSKSVIEGIHVNNFYGTYLLGPLLVRNPYFTKYLVKEILKNKNIEYHEYINVDEEKAYLEYVHNFIKPE